MKTKMQRLEEEFNRRTSTIEEIKGWIGTLEKKKADLEAEQKAAAIAGDFGKFRALKEQETDTDLDIYVKQAMLEKAAEPISREDARAAWDEYSTLMQKKVKDADAEYLKLRAQLAKAYMAKMDLYVEVCRKRQQMGKLIGLNNIPVSQVDLPDKLGQFAFPFIPIQDILSDQAYFTAKEALENKAPLYANATTNHIVDPL